MRDKPFDGGQKLKKKGKHLSWFDYELCLVVKDALMENVQGTNTGSVCY